MLRTNTCGELRLSDINKQVTLCGWVQKSRDLGGLTFIDLRDRYGITQLAFNEDVDKEMNVQARSVSREFVIKVTGTVIECSVCGNHSGSFRERSCGRSIVAQRSARRQKPPRNRLVYQGSSGGGASAKR